MSDIWHDPLFLALSKKRSQGGTVSGAVASFTADSAAPLRSLLVNIEPVQAGTGDPSPDNVRPISGWSAVNVWRTGKNLFNPQSTSTAWVDWKGNITTVSSAKTVKILARAGGTFTLSNANASSGTNSLLIAFFDETDTIISSRHIVTTGEKFVTATAPVGTDYMIAGYYRWSESVEQQLELGSTATTYEPYSGNQYTIQLGQTVYGGTLDVTSGVLTVDKRYFVADGDTIKAAAGYGGSGPNWLPIFNVASNPAKGGVRTIAASYLKETSAVTRTENSIYAANRNQIVLHIGTMQGTDGTHGYNSYQECLAAVNAYLVENPLQMCYTLATPITIPLTPQEISTLQGANNLWADSGDVTVEYSGLNTIKPSLLAALIKKQAGT